MAVNHWVAGSSPAGGAEKDLQENNCCKSFLFYIDIAELLIEKGADVNAADSKGMSPLMWAVGRKYSRIAKLLVKKGADVFAKDKQGQPLNYYVDTKKTIAIFKKAGLKFDSLNSP